MPMTLGNTSSRMKRTGVKKDNLKTKYDSDFNPKPWLITFIAKGYVDNLGDVFSSFSELTLRQIVEFLVGCTADEAGEWMRVLTIHKPVLAVWVIELYSAKVAREKKRVSAFMRKHIPIAIMPNGITRSTSKPGSCFDP